MKLDVFLNKLFGYCTLNHQMFQFRVNELGLMELVEESDGTDEEMDMDVDEMFKKCENIPMSNKAKPESDGKLLLHSFIKY
jgi:hypothetical protein